MVVPKKKCWGGASAVKVPTVTGVKEVYRAKSIALAEKTKNSIMDITLHSPVASSLDMIQYGMICRYDMTYYDMV